jgi:hypothetical protein
VRCVDEGLCEREREAGVAGQPDHVHVCLPIGRGWPRLEAARSLVWRWQGVVEGELAEASGRLSST